ncbi:helix-turn-helix domain-containing protein [Bacillus cereus]
MIDIENNMNEVTTGEPLERGGYFVAYNYVMRNAMKVFKLSSGEFSCLTMLFSYAGADKDKCFPGQEKLAGDLNTTKRTVIRYLEGLENKGAIITYNRYNKTNMKTKNIYDLSPCLKKIRELFTKKEDEQFVVVRKKQRNERSDKSDTTENIISLKNELKKVIVKPETNVVTKLSPPKQQTGQNCHPTNNNIQITNINNIKDIDDDKANFVRPAYTQEDLHNIIESLREVTKNELTKRSFESVVRKVMDKHNQGKIKASFRDYLVTSLNAKIEELELRRAKDKAKEIIRNTKKNQKPTPYTGQVPIYNWLEEDK